MWSSQDGAMLFCQKDSSSLNIILELCAVVYVVRQLVHIYPQVQISNLQV